MKKKSKYFDDEDNLKWKHAFVTEKEDALVRDDFIRVCGTNYHTIEEAESAMQSSKRQYKLLKASIERWKELINLKKNGGEKC